MKKLLCSLFTLFLLSSASVHAQITITSADMPVSGDTLRYSNASTLGSIVGLGDSGANVTWNYGGLTPLSQAVDTYKTAAMVNPLFAFSIPLSAYGYKIADTLPVPGGTLPVSITNVYTFFEKISSPSSYAAVAFGASLSGIPTPATYTTNDTWYFFPLTYGNNDSSDFELNVSIPSLGAIKRTGYRKSRVDGWGSITTPYITAASAIRIRSEIHETDSITFASTTFGLPNNTVEYKWLANGEHYPLVWVTTFVTPGGGSENITSVKYRDVARTITTAVPQVTGNNIEMISAYPVPATDGIVMLGIPASWTHYHVEVFDVNSRNVMNTTNEATVDMRALPSGQYIAKITSGDRCGYARLEK